MPLGQFSAPLLSGWQAALIKAGVGPGTIHKARTLLSSVLRHAAENGAIMANPLSLVRAPTVGAAGRGAAALTRRRRAHPRRDAEPAPREVGASSARAAQPDGATSCLRPARHRPGSGTR